MDIKWKNCHFFKKHNKPPGIQPSMLLKCQMTYWQEHQLSHSCRYRKYKRENVDNINWFLEFHLTVGYGWTKWLLEVPSSPKFQQAYVCSTIIRDSDPLKCLQAFTQEDKASQFVFLFIFTRWFRNFSSDVFSPLRKRPLQRSTSFVQILIHN